MRVFVAGARADTLVVVSSHREHAHLDAALEEVWELVGTPTRHPEWWPRVVEVLGERFDQGDEYAQVTKRPGRGTVTTNFLVERREDLREVRMSCQQTGMYADWTLTPAQGGTFVELEMGMLPRGFGNRVFDLTLAAPYFRRWASESIDGLRSALERASAISSTQSAGRSSPRG
jgi:Polyketide cyclase / dehydrase and lipid transport